VSAPSRLSLLSLALILAASAVAQAQTAGPIGFSPGATAEVGFSPGGTAEALVVKVINAAHASILCAAYEFTSRPITRALIAASVRGVKVYLVADAREAQGRYSQTRELSQAGISVRLDSRYEIFHHKFLVVDRRDLETGSFNYTASAFRHNAENVLVIWNDPGLATVYTSEWTALWDQSRPLR